MANHGNGGKILGLDVGRHIGFCLEFPAPAGGEPAPPPVLLCDVVCPAKAGEPELRDGATASLDRFFEKPEHRLGRGDTVVIERQVRQNERCRRLEQHLVSYFYFRMPDPAARPRIVVQSAKLKGMAHGAPRVRGPELKQWAVRTVEAILAARGLPPLPVPVGADRPSRGGKKEDVADAFLTVSAFRATGGRFPARGGGGRRVAKKRKGAPEAGAATPRRGRSCASRPARPRGRGRCGPPAPAAGQAPC